MFVSAVIYAFSECILQWSLIFYCIRQQNNFSIRATATPWCNIQAHFHIRFLHSLHTISLASLEWELKKYLIYNPFIHPPNRFSQHELVMLQKQKQKHSGLNCMSQTLNRIS